MKDKILILGKGFIGSRIQEELGCAVSEEKITSFKDAQEIINKHNPKVIINCIGYTGQNVDQCELEIDKCLTANAFVPLILAEAVARSKENVKLVHISSGCIYHYDYDNDPPIKEIKVPDFFDLFYSRTKIYSEAGLYILSSKRDILITRIRIPLDNRPHPRNLLNKLISYRRVIDMPNSITYIPDFLKALRHLLEIDARGLYNIVNKGALKYPELLEIYRKYAKDFKYEIIPDLGSLVRTNLILSTEELEKTGFKMRDVHEVLEECVRDYLKY